MYILVDCVCFLFSTYDICYILMILELRMVVVYTDYYMYFEVDGICREVRHWSMYMYVVVVS